ncbi:phosphate ABC transporter ATP-binding protein [Microcoleus sp. ZQ-A2]
MAGSALVTSEDYITVSTPEPVETIHKSPQYSGLPHPLIQTEQLSLHYGEKPIFADVTLPIHEGCITALVGPSGCGKTSFLSCLNRLTDLIPRCRVSGRIQMDLLDILDAKIDAIALRRRVGMIFQKPNPFPLTIWKNLALPLHEHGVRNREQVDQIIETTLQDVGLWDEVKDRLNAPALSLSGGQQQRLCIARALVLKPEVLLLDEPCSALDPISSGVVEDLIASLRGRYTQLIVTHNLAQARRIADYAALFWVQDGVGRLIEYGTVEQIFETPQEALTAAYVTGIRG